MPKNEYIQTSIVEFIEQFQKNNKEKKATAQIVKLSSKVSEKKYLSNESIERAIKYSKSLNW
jgi:hypothetical protein